MPVEVLTLLEAMLSLCHRLIAWLCLALVVLTGLAPVQGFVVCIEADGCVSIEVEAADGNCRGCERSGEVDSTVQAAATQSDEASCPCIDVPVPGSPDQQLTQSRSIELHDGSWIVPPPEIRVRHAVARDKSGRGPPPCIPRIADFCKYIRTVVLLV